MSGFSMSKVAGVLTAANGNPVAGALVTATLSEAVHNAGVSYSGSFNTKTSATGRFEISVPSNTDEGTFPAGSFYTFSCLAASLVSEVIVPPSSTLLQFASLPVAPSAAGEVASVFGRTGVVVAKSGDYTAAQVTGAASETFAKAEAEAKAKAAVEGQVAPSVFLMPFGATAPATPVEGETYFDTAKKEIGLYTGSSWIYTGALS